MANVIIGSARIDENGKAHGGKSGDQTGRELSSQAWYRHDKGWVLLRPKDPVKAEKIARNMEKACANQNIGYDQYQRDTLYSMSKPLGFDCSLVKTKCETDCSALVRVCCAFAGIVVSNFRTTNQASVLMASGQFEKLTDDKYTRKSDYLRRGDVLVTKSQGHTVVVLSDGPKAEAAITTPVQPSMPPVPAHPYTNWVVATSDVNIRTGPGANYRKRQVLLKGTGMVFDNAIQGEWYAVWWNGMRCWVHSRYCKIEVREKPIIDLSQHNGAVYFGTLKDEISYAWIRVGIRSLTSNGTIKKDTKFDAYAKALRSNGVPFGVYFYGRAKTVAGAVAEAEAATKWAEQYGPTTYAYDIETPTNTHAAVQRFLDHVTQKTGKAAGIYVGRRWKQVAADKLRAAFRWGPYYRKGSGGLHGRNPTNTYDVHQWTCSYKFKGTAGAADASHLHGPITIEQLRSGFKAVSPK